MKKQYISPTATAETVSIQHFLQTESVTELEGGVGYGGSGHGGGRAPRRGRGYYEEDIPQENDSTWFSLW